MATRKVTFTLPEDLAEAFFRSVGPSRRSKYVSEAIRLRLLEREQMLKEACLAANDDPETRQIQADFDAMPDVTSEVWDDSVAR